MGRSAALAASSSSRICGRWLRSRSFGISVQLPLVPRPSALLRLICWWRCWGSSHRLGASTWRSSRNRCRAPQPCRRHWAPLCRWQCHAGMLANFGSLGGSFRWHGRNFGPSFCYVVVISCCCYCCCVLLLCVRVCLCELLIRICG